MTYVKKSVLENVRNLLIQVARERKTVTYVEVARWAGFDTKSAAALEPLNALLNRISLDEHKAGRPLLSVVVVRAREGTPGDGFYRLARRLKLTDKSDRFYFVGRETTKVYEFWARRPLAMVAAPSETD